MQVQQLKAGAKQNTKSNYVMHVSELLTIRDLQVNAVTVVCVAAVCVEHSLSTQAVDGLTRWD